MTNVDDIIRSGFGRPTTAEQTTENRERRETYREIARLHNDGQDRAAVEERHRAEQAAADANRSSFDGGARGEPIHFGDVDSEFREALTANRAWMGSLTADDVLPR